MKQNKTAYLLTACLALASASYLPQASASTVLTPASATVIDNTVSAGIFENIYDFVIDNVYNAYNLSGAVSFQTVQTIVSQTEDFSTPFVTSTTGISNATVELLDSTSAVIATGSLTSFSVASTPVLVTLPFPNTTPFYQELLTTFNLISLNNIPVLGAGNYQLAIKGLSNGGTYTGSLSVSPIIPTAVPLPTATWLFLSGLVGVLGLKRRKSLAA
ncbi:hypothetical protein NP603_06810 [Methylomonas sp. SURF-1]|uniref:VPLPA-CTERM protein sorting domain-containing protein n=1 Tax=Methylomonas aurea TaxID=2952224 RepID=A0ABT1UEZ7_9GAMM|nr:hypothetical protein [Methylomonas sp. SURF-1]MCQ8180811.1 hypothetical protein [Methylomonas sp. SURF-1]